MSSNDQTSIIEHKGKWYVFSDVMAESWDERNELPIKEAEGEFDSLDKAFQKAVEIDNRKTEYGIIINYCYKDQERIYIKE